MIYVTVSQSHEFKTRYLSINKRITLCHLVKRMLTKRLFNDIAIVPMFFECSGKVTEYGNGRWNVWDGDWKAMVTERSGRVTKRQRFIRNTFLSINIPSCALCIWQIQLSSPKSANWNHPRSANEVEIRTAVWCDWCINELCS